MKIFEVSDRTESLINKLLVIWEDSVKATHLFLSNEEMNKIKEYVPQALEEVTHLIIMENEDNIPVAFMGIEGKRILWTFRI